MTEDQTGCFFVDRRIHCVLWDGRIGITEKKRIANLPHRKEALK